MVGGKKLEIRNPKHKTGTFCHLFHKTQEFFGFDFEI